MSPTSSCSVVGSSQVYRLFVAMKYPLRASSLCKLIPVGTQPFAALGVSIPSNPTLAVKLAKTSSILLWAASIGLASTFPLKL